MEEDILSFPKSFTVEDNRKSETCGWNYNPNGTSNHTLPCKPNGWGTTSTSESICYHSWGVVRDWLLPCAWLMFSAQVPKLPNVIWKLGSKDFEAFRTAWSPSCIITCCCFDFWREVSSTCPIESLEMFIFHQDVLCTLDMCISHASKKVNNLLRHGLVIGIPLYPNFSLQVSQNQATFHHQPSTNCWKLCHPIPCESW